MAKTSGCFTIVINEEVRILLAKPKDYPLWDLPGGAVEMEEPLENCAIRETEEETGYIVSIRRKIGEYYQPQYDDIQYLFLGELKGGSPIKYGPETEKVEWFSPNKLPLLIIPNRRKQIKNHLKHRSIVVKDSITVSHFKILLYKGFLRVLSKML
ncbi:NUDIX hydrolase [Virgibacillus necropolis]|uniref:NUDIX hydrolase n=1 Tax=Virgibacillus necropolis TaxID=163877 RepID=UPI00384B78B4